MTFASMLAMVVGSGPITVYTQGSFLKPLTTQFHWSRAEYFLPYTLAGLVGALAVPIVGHLADRFGSRRILLLGIVAYGLANASLALLTGSVLQFSVLMLVVGVVAMTQSNLLYAKIVSSWIDERRGLALALVISGTGLGGVLVPPLATAMIHTFGWRAARLGLSGAIFMVALPSIYFFIFDGPDKTPISPLQAEKEPVVGATVQDALRSGTFWLLFVAFLFGVAAATAVVTNLVPLLNDHGLTGSAAASALSLLAAGQIAGRLLSGYLLDRVASPKAGLIWFICALIGVFTLATATNAMQATVGALLVGLGYGAEGELAAYFTGRYFGLRSFGAIYGVIVAAVIVGAALGPLCAGYLFDRYGNYGAAVTAIEVAFVICAVCIALLRGYAYRPRAR